MLKKVVAFLIGTMLCVSLLPISAWAEGRYSVLMLGDEDKYVMGLQQKLYKSKYLATKPTGFFGTATQEAVMKFQKKKSIAVDGKAGTQTLKALYGKQYKAIPKTRKVSDVVNKIKDSSHMIYPGDKGKVVTDIQTKLKQLGYYKYKITGYYGADTANAVKRFQKENKIEVDGVVGAETRNLLQKKKKPTIKTVLMYDEGEQVKKIQQRLKTLKYFSGEVTSYFGPMTQEAVVKFQKAHKLEADGEVGSATYIKLFSSSAKKYVAPKKTSTKSLSAKAKEARKKKIEKMISLSKAKMGCKYVLGAAGPKTFDCSGLIYYSLLNMGVITPRTSLDMSRYVAWSYVEKSKLQRGDFVFFKTTNAPIGHVGIYLGSGQFLHASSAKRKVMISDLNSDYWKNTYRGARRTF